MLLIRWKIFGYLWIRLTCINHVAGAHLASNCHVRIKITLVYEALYKNHSLLGFRKPAFNWDLSTFPNQTPNTWKGLNGENCLKPSMKNNTEKQHKKNPPLCWLVVRATGPVPAGFNLTAKKHICNQTAQNKQRKKHIIIKTRSKEQKNKASGGCTAFQHYQRSGASVTEYMLVLHPPTHSSASVPRKKTVIIAGLTGDHWGQWGVCTGTYWW